jgi:DUF971 family protein
LSTERFPTGITLRQKSRVMEIAFSDGRSVRLPYECLRVSQYLGKLAAACASRE